MNKSRRKFFGVLAIAIVALFACACIVGFAACGDDGGSTNSDATVSNVTLDKSELDLTVGGDAGLLTANVTMSDGGSYGGGYSWSSSNSSVATVSLSGNPATVTAVSSGTATITVTVNNNKTATCTVTVTASTSGGGTTGGTTGGNQGTTEDTEVTGVSKIRAEAEYAQIDVDESGLHYWLHNEIPDGDFIYQMGFLFNVQDDTQASNGQLIGYLAHDNPTATFVITSDVAASATLTLHATSCDVQPNPLGGTLMGGSEVYGLIMASINEYKGTDHDILTVNGQKVTFSGSLSGNESLFDTTTDNGLAVDNWGDLTATINLVAGANTIVLTHDDAGIGWDYIEIDTGNTVANLSFTQTDNAGLECYDEEWEAYDDVTLEAETDAVLTDASGSSNVMQTTSTGVSNFTKDDEITFNVTASAATGEAYIYVYGTSSGGTLSASDITITVDSTALSDVTYDSGTGTILAKIDSFTEGNHSIVIKCASESALTIDKVYIDFDYAGGDTGHYVVSTLVPTTSAQS